jgi:hypothetical protein
MNKVNLITLAVVIVVLITGTIIFLMRDDTLKPEEEIAKASAEFKANPGFRQHTASKLVPHLRIGMTTNEVESLLGKPDNEREYGDGVLYEYVLFYSLFLDVQFDSNGKVQEIVACAPGLGDESIDKDKPSGYYKLGPNQD